jgi:kynurenine formamidase
MNPNGTGRLLAELEVVYSNGIVVEADGSIVWVESYTGAVKRRSTDARYRHLLPVGRVPTNCAFVGNKLFATDGGARAISIDEVPLEWCLQPGVKLDFRHLPDGYLMQPEDIDAELGRIGHVLQPPEIVVANTAAGARYGQEDYIDCGCGFGRSATLHLVRQGIRVVGTDGWSWDAPFNHTARRFAETADASLIWEGHKAGREAGYCQIEKLHNLEALPPDGFLISCFPVKVRSGSAGWTRAVAIIA